MRFHYPIKHGIQYALHTLTGMKNSATIFQKCIEQCIQGSKGTLVYQDDVLVYAEMAASLRTRLVAVRNRLVEKGSTINEEKSINCTEEITFLAFVFRKMAYNLISA